MIKINNNFFKFNNDRLNFKNKIKVSFEFFPPAVNSNKNIFLDSIKKLAICCPDFYSITHSVNAYNKNNTYIVLKTIRNILKDIVIIPHLTSIGYSSLKLEKIAVKYWKQGIKNIVALRGDLPCKEYSNKIYAIDLIKILRKVADFNIFVAAYPEIHPESGTVENDLKNLKNKIDAGANSAITQFFFDVNKFLHFRDNCFKNNININIIPGILPILNIQQLKKFSSMTNVFVPSWILDFFSQNIHNYKKCNLLSIEIAVNIIVQLYKEGINKFHLYTLNRSELSLGICKRLGLV